MQVLKFGGTSLGNGERIRNVASIIPDNQSVIVVVSAMSGTTNLLVDIADLFSKGNIQIAKSKFVELQIHYHNLVSEMFSDQDLKSGLLYQINLLFDYYSGMLSEQESAFRTDAFICLGELLSSYILWFELQYQKRKVRFVSAFDLIKTNENNQPDYDFIKKTYLNLNFGNEKEILLTQGFICIDFQGYESNLGRGGSDYTAAVLGSVADAKEVQIWTDIDGFHNNDPRFVKNTRTIPYLSFDEAAELAYFGAKILHPATILPCRLKNIPVRLKNTLNPVHPGTLITENYVPAGIKAVAAKDGIAAIHIKSNNMLMAHGFLKRVFSVFDTFKTSVDTITTSEVAVSLTIDSLHRINEIILELSTFSTVEVEYEHSIVCIVGDFMTEKPGLSFKLFESLKNIPVRMISFGGSKNNISVLIKTSYKKQTLNALQKILSVPIHESEEMNLHHWLPEFKKRKTPFYFYDIQLLTETLENVVKASSRRNFKIYYAVKANANARILKLISSFGLGADCVSGNEILAALENGFKASDIVYAGVGKSEDEIELAIKLNIFCFHCENLQEIEIIQQKASLQNKKVNIALRINPGVDAKTHAYITTGTRQNKFGLSADDLQKAMVMIPKMDHINLIGLHLHIGSQITDMQVFERLSHAINEIQASQKISEDFTYINVGGGLGVDYANPGINPIPDFDAYFEVFNTKLNLKSNQFLHFELGRSIVAQCGSLISKVEYTKGDEGQKFVILDAGMNDLMRPALYQAQHKIVNLSNKDETEKCDIVGPVCESSDTFAKSVEISRAERGDILALLSAGAYGEVMSSNYNLRSRSASFYSDEY